MFNINTTCNVVLSVAPQTQQFVTQSLETLKSFLMLYTAADVQAVNDLAAKQDQLKAKLDLVDFHLQQTGTKP